MKIESSKPGFYTWALVATGFAIPLTIQVSSISLIFLVLAWLFSSTFNEKLSRLHANWTIGMPFAFYFIVLLVIATYGNTSDEGINQLEKNISFVLLPLIIFSGKTISKTTIIKILQAFIISCLLVFLVDIWVATELFIKTNNGQVYFYDLLSEVNSPFEHNPVYLSVYFLFGTIASIYLFSIKKSKTMAVISMIVFVVGIFLLSSKVIFALLILFVLFGFIKAYSSAITPKGKKLVVYGILAVSIFLAGLAVVLGPTLTKRYQEISSFKDLEIVSEGSMTDFSKVNGLTLRLMLWRWSLDESFRDGSWIFGQGLGSAQSYLDTIYEKHNMALTISESKKLGYYGYNTHNQYIESFIKGGILGILSLLIVYCFNFIRAVRSKDIVFIGLIVSIIAISFTESFWEANKGIVFSAYFMSIYLFYTHTLNRLPGESSDIRYKGNSQ